MKKDMVKEIRKALKAAGLKRDTLYRTTDEVFRIKVAMYHDSDYEEDADRINKSIKKQIHETLVVLQDNGLRPRFEIETIRYQGFINVVNLKFR
jgi:hypothetical protein